MSTVLNVAQMIDHTVLSPYATDEQIIDLCAQADEWGVYAVCVSPTFVPLVVSTKKTLDYNFYVATVVGFPSGKHESIIKALEAKTAVDQGADEVDMVIDVGQIKQGEYGNVARDIDVVRRAVPDAVLKVIVESAELTREELLNISSVVKMSDADFIKTSTGFAPSGGAGVEAVSIMNDVVQGEIGIKASGGIRSASDAIAMINAGATRLGTSSTKKILDEIIGELN